MEEEVEAHGIDEVTDKVRTVFSTNKDGELILWDYQIKGFFKDACGMEPAVIEWLDYGQLRGLGQWRNSGKGTFTYEILE